MKNRLIVPNQKLIRRLDVADLEVKSIDESTRTIWHPVTREVVDRMGDIVRIDGANLDEFKKKPAVLYGHDYRSMNPIPVIAENVGFEKVGDKLYAGTKFLDSEALSANLRDLISDNWILHGRKLLGWSIGFIPTKWDAMMEKGEFQGYDIKEWQLLEYSSVIIPAHQDAVNDALKGGRISGAVVKYFDLGETPRTEPQQAEPAPAVSPATGPVPIKQADTTKGGNQNMWEKILSKLEKGEELTPEEKEFMAKIGAVLPQPAAAAPQPAPVPVRRLELTDTPAIGRTKHMSEIMSLPSSRLSAEEKELRDFADDAYIVSSILRKDPSQTKFWRQRTGLSSSLRKAMDTATATEGAEWVPTQLSQNYIEKFRLQAKVAALFDDIPMPSNPFKLPYVGGLGASSFYLVGESKTDSPTAPPATTMATGDQTLTAKKLKARTLWSEEFDEDSILAVLPILRNEIVIAGAEAVEDCLLNGDTTATHMDSDVTDSKDRRKIWDGVGDQCPSGTKQSLATFNSSNLKAILTAMGKYAINPNDLAIIVGAKGYHNMTGLSEVMTVDKYGPQATILNGELGKFFGVPIIVSEAVRENLNASGVYDGSTTTKSILLVVNRRGLIIGTRGGVKLNFLTEAVVDQNQLIISFRKALAYRWTPSASVTTIGLGYNF